LAFYLIYETFKDKKKKESGEITNEWYFCFWNWRIIL
jgi:hypothetical protein